MTETIIIPAAVGGVSGVFNLDVKGTVFAVVAADTDFQVSFDSGPLQDMTVGRKVGNPYTPPELQYQIVAKRRVLVPPVAPEGEFNRLAFYNPGVAAISVTFYAGYEDFTVSSTITSVSKQSTPAGSGIQTINNGAGNDVAVAADASRDHAEVENLSAGGRLYLLDANGNVFGTVPAGAGRIVAGGSAFKIRNVSGAAIDYCYALFK